MAIVAGVDVGSLCTKTVILDGEGDILSYDIMRSGHYYQGAAEESIANALKSAGLKKGDISYTLGTGYGRGAVAEADAEVTEITCHARGAVRLSPEVHTVIDIGGQDSKVIGIGDNSRVTNFVMNDKCAAGTGRFLEVMALALSVDIGEMGDLYFASKEKVEVSSMCTVFAESEVISLFAQGHKKADIAAAIADSIARRIVGMVGQQVGLKEKVIMSGGGCKERRGCPFYRREDRSQSPCLSRTADCWRPWSCNYCFRAGIVPIGNMVSSGANAVNQRAELMKVSFSKGCSATPQMDFLQSHQSWNTLVSDSRNRHRHKLYKGE